MRRKYVFALCTVSVHNLKTMALYNLPNCTMMTCTLPPKPKVLKIMEKNSVREGQKDLILEEGCVMGGQFFQRGVSENVLRKWEIA